MPIYFDKEYISVCCGAPVFAVGDDDDIDGKGLGGTYHYECNQCGKPCKIKKP